MLHVNQCLYSVYTVVTLCLLTCLLLMYEWLSWYSQERSVSQEHSVRSALSEAAYPHGLTTWVVFLTWIAPDVASFTLLVATGDQACIQLGERGKAGGPLLNGFINKPQGLTHVCQYHMAAIAA
jgi:hypothetical protein